MAKPALKPSPCAPTDCGHCSTREHNPICTVEDALPAVQNSRSSVRFRAGQTIFLQGNEPSGLFTIQTGLAKLESLGSDGAAHTLRLMGPGQVLGYRALFAGDTYRASAVAVEDMTACFIPKAVLLSVVAQNPTVGLNLLGQLSKDLRIAEEKWVTQIDKDAPERVAEALLFLNDNFQNQPWTRREIAEWAGTTPETVIRTLSQFERIGWIQADGRVYKILKREELAKKAHGA